VDPRPDHSRLRWHDGRGVRRPGEEAKLFASDAEFVALFGSSVDIEGDVAIAGAPRDGGTDLTGIGAAYVFRREADGQWVEEAKLPLPFMQTGDEAGASVAIRGDLALVGVPGTLFPFEGDICGDCGAVYLYRRIDGEWAFIEALYDPERQPGDRLGAAIALSGATLVAGAPLDDAPAFNTGSASVFTVVGADCDMNDSLDILDFVCFQHEFSTASPAADVTLDGLLNILDFISFQQLFVSDCR